MPNVQTPVVTVPSAGSAPKVIMPPITPVTGGNVEPKSKPAPGVISQLPPGVPPFWVVLLAVAVVAVTTAAIGKVNKDAERMLVAVTLISILIAFIGTPAWKNATGFFNSALTTGGKK